MHYNIKKIIIRQIPFVVYFNNLLHNKQLLELQLNLNIANNNTRVHISSETRAETIKLSHAYRSSAYYWFHLELPASTNMIIYFAKYTTIIID